MEVFVDQVFCVETYVLSGIHLNTWAFNVYDIKQIETKSLRRHKIDLH